MGFQVEMRSERYPLHSLSCLMDRVGYLLLFIYPSSCSICSIYFTHLPTSQIFIRLLAYENE